MASLQEYARTKVSAALRHTSRPVLYARINLDLAVDAAPRSTRAGVEIDLNGTVLWPGQTRRPRQRPSTS